MADVTIIIKENTMEELKRLKDHYQVSSLDDVLKELIIERKKIKGGNPKR